MSPEGVIRTPTLLALIVCDQVIQDRATHKKSLIGMFDRVFARTMPCVHAEMHVYVAVTDGRGPVPASLSLRHAGTDEVLLEAHGRIDFPDPLAVVETQFGLKGVRFPDFGLYIFEFAVQDVPIGTRKFRVERAAARS